VARFNPDFYRQFRPFYPAALYAELPGLLSRNGHRAPYEIADIGCGTGHSAASLLRSGVEARLTCMDPDPMMLDCARNLAGLKATFLEGSGEATGLHASSVCAITVGSAFHWMDPLRAREEFVRILASRGLILIYEYQFPKCPRLPAVNDWIRREFNLRWKAPNQVPRGDFENVTLCFRQDPRIRALGDRRVPMILPLTAGDLAGLIFSQSRVLHFETGMSVEERAEFHLDVTRQLQGLMGEGSSKFDFNLRSGMFELKE
jgi:SAM-dependent methyltransferase